MRDLKEISDGFKRHIELYGDTNVLFSWTEKGPFEMHISEIQKAIERAIAAEVKVIELENQADALATTVNMYVTPYYNMRERAIKAEEEIAVINAVLVVTDMQLQDANKEVERLKAKLKKIDDYNYMVHAMTGD
jgi:chromosome segregation ATPase